MDAVIHSLTPLSPAASTHLWPGDRILAVNGKTDLEDMFDYQFEVMDTSTVTFLILRTVSGQSEPGTTSQELSVTIEKAPDEDPGIIFTSPIFTPIKTCVNACPFCFIDQQPSGLRASLYIKDDDYRLSYFNNTYITLTNLSKKDRDRIAMIRPGPLYISVHSTVPEIREKLLLNPKAGKIMTELRWLKNLEIPFHCQIVVCPDFNEGNSLTQTLHDLAGLRPEALSVAVVPIGLTQYRGHLPDMQPVDVQTAQDTVTRVTDFQKRHPDFVFLSDEFYLKAGLPLPDYDDYGDFPQLEDGVGTARLLTEDFFALAATLPATLSKRRNVIIFTGKLAAMALQPIITRLNEIDGLYVDILPVESRFWGDSVGVAGLVTGQDIIDALSGMVLKEYEFALIPSVMLKQGTDLFLDGKTVSEISESIRLPIRIVEDPYSAAELITCLDIPITSA